VPPASSSGSFRTVRRGHDGADGKRVAVAPGAAVAAAPAAVVLNVGFESVTSKTPLVPFFDLAWYLPDRATALTADVTPNPAAFNTFRRAARLNRVTELSEACDQGARGSTGTAKHGLARVITERPKLSAAEFVGAANPAGPCHFTQGMLSADMRVRLVGDGSCVPVPVADTVVTGVVAVVVGDAD
jgi:hypothetical protein